LEGSAFSVIRGGGCKTGPVPQTEKIVAWYGDGQGSLTVRGGRVRETEGGERSK